MTSTAIDLSNPPALALDVGRLLSKVDSLPTIPLVAAQIGDAIEDTGADAKKLANLLRNDQALTAKVLKLVNSSYYAIPGGVSDVAHAITYLGHNTLYQLALSISVFGILGTGDVCGGLEPKDLWQHALGCATLSEELARVLDLPSPQTYFTAGLLHDIGKVALLDLAPQQFQQVVAIAYDKGISLSQATLLTHLPNHESVGARLAERWSFPHALRCAITHHRCLQPSRRARMTPLLGQIVDITALANIMVRRFEFGNPGDPVIPDINPVLLDRLNLTLTRTQDLHDDFRYAVDRSTILLNLLEGG